MECININEQLISQPKRILKELNNYYENLVGINAPLYQQMLEINGLKVLIDSQKLKYEGLGTDSECKKALDAMINRIGPGCDELTAEYYKKMAYFSYTLIEAFSYAYGKGSYQNYKNGESSHYYKKGKNPTLVKNWRNH